MDWNEVGGTLAGCVFLWGLVDLGRRAGLGVWWVVRMVRAGVKASGDGVTSVR